MFFLGIPQDCEYKVGKTGIVKFGFQKYGEIRKFNVRRRERNSEDWVLIKNDLTDSQFELEFTPMNLEDNRLEINCEFESIEGGTIIVPLDLKLNVTE